MNLQEYFSMYPDMKGAVDRVTLEVSKVFPDAQFAVEIYQDPEIDDEHLVVYVRLNNYPENVMDRIADIRRKLRCYLGNRSSWLHLTTDFRSVMYTFNRQEGVWLTQ